MNLIKQNLKHLLKSVIIGANEIYKDDAWSSCCKIYSWFSYQWKRIYGLGRLQICHRNSWFRADTSDKDRGRIPDILARKQRNLVAIECKGERECGRQILEAIGQVVYYKKASHNQYIGCPDSLVDDTVYDICRYLNVGLLIVDRKLEVTEELKPYWMKSF